jgi:hypothetical protein
MSKRTRDVSDAHLAADKWNFESNKTIIETIIIYWT